MSQFLIAEVIYGGDRDAEDVVFRTLLFKLFNRVTTWQGLERALGGVSWRAYDSGRYAAALDELAACGPIYSPAYIIPPPRLGATRKHRNHLRLLELMMGDGLAAAEAAGEVERLGGPDGEHRLLHDAGHVALIAVFPAADQDTGVGLRNETPTQGR